MAKMRNEDILAEATLTPAYGRDFKSADTAREGFLRGQDWQVNHYGMSGGHYCSVRDFQQGERVFLRFNKRRDTTYVTVPSKEEVKKLSNPNYMPIQTTK